MILSHMSSLPGEAGYLYRMLQGHGTVYKHRCRAAKFETPKACTQNALAFGRDRSHDVIHCGYVTRNDISGTGVALLEHGAGTERCRKSDGCDSRLSE